MKTIETYKATFSKLVEGFGEYRTVSTLICAIDYNHARALFSKQEPKANIIDFDLVDTFECPDELTSQYIAGAEIQLHHYRNMATFKKHYPNAYFIGFECGYWGPTYLVEEFNGLPKSCTIDYIR